MQEPSIQARKLNLLFLVRQINRNYTQLRFTGGDETITNTVKCGNIDAENAGTDLQNDSSTDLHGFSSRARIGPHDCFRNARDNARE